MTKKINIRAGASLHLSEPGYYNFYYPSKKLANILEDEEVEVVNWVKFDGKVPLKVSTSNVSGVSSSSPYIVLWADEREVSDPMFISEKTKDELISLLKDGIEARVASDMLGVKVEQVRAIKAHLTMGTYS